MPANARCPSSKRGAALSRLAVAVALGGAVALGLGLVTGDAFAQDDSALGSGKVSVSTRPVKGSDVSELVVRAVIDAPPEKVWQIVSDCGRFEQRMPNIEAAREIKREGNRTWCDVELHLPFPLSNLRAVSVATHTESTGVWSRTWELVEGDYEFNDGSWVLTPFENDWNRTLAVYKVHAKPKTAVPDWVREKAQKSAMPDLIERIRAEVRKLK